jgi:hypothetical protein
MVSKISFSGCVVGWAGEAVMVVVSLFIMAFVVMAIEVRWLQQRFQAAYIGLQNKAGGFICGLRQPENE